MALGVHSASRVPPSAPAAAPAAPSAVSRKASPETSPAPAASPEASPALVLAHLKLSPAPSSLAEVQHLLDSLRQLGAVEYFRVPRENSLRRFSPHCFVLFNAAGSRLSPFAEADPGAGAPATALSAALAALVALPRFSYIENDADYAAGRTAAPFRHTLTKHALDLEGRFAVSPATSVRHLCLASPVEAALPRFRKELRHNFQKFHKFDFVSVATGVDAVRMVTPGDHAP